MLTSAQAEPWIATAEKISSDELAVLVVGKPPKTPLQGEEVVPCKNRDGHMVLISCRMYQLGAKIVTF
jgi:chaperone required for assembly of F1-ATPase